MILHTILDTLQNTGFWSTIADIVKFPDLFTGSTNCTQEFNSTCPASAFNVITAAFATQGYWMQADILDYMQYGGMGTFAILIYVLAAIAGIFSMAMGAPPKMYGWFFMGPYIFYWLTETTTPDTSVDGVRVMMGQPGGSFFSLDAASNEQSKVWRYAKVGLEGMGIFQRRDCYLDPDNGYSPVCNTSNDDEVGDGAIFPAYFFVKFDALVSSVVEQMIDWTGVYYINSKEQGDEITVGRNGTISPDHLVSNMKWGILEDITSAKLVSPEVRDLFVNFLSNECGDGFAQGIDPQSFVAANSARSGYFPENIFYQGTPNSGKFETLRQALQDKAIPRPRAVAKLISLRGMDMPGSFLSAMGSSQENLDQFARRFGKDTVHCLDLLQLVVLTFRWQAASVFYQILTNAPPGMAPGRMLQNFLYGWPISEELYEDGALSSAEAVQEFFINLIMLHMFRNEFAIAPQPLSKSNSGSKDSIAFSEAYQRTVGQKTKFSELYTWALMTPYLQGVLMYFLALAYPFVCMLMIIPGWHKILGTWCSFWIWVKLWDLGFAVVTVLERSVWSIIGNDYDATTHLKKLIAAKQWGTHTIECPGVGREILTRLCTAEKPIPDVSLNLQTNFGTIEEFFRSMYRLDLMMTLGSSLNLDLANSYYIYVMAALYFAVPAVLGQVVLGAKAGAAGLATNAFSQSASEVGRSAGSAYSGDLGKRAEQAAAQAKQTFTAKSMRGTGEAASYVGQALEQGARALDREAHAGYMGEVAHGLSRLSRLQSLGVDEWKEATGTATGLSQDHMSTAAAIGTMTARAFGLKKNGAAPPSGQGGATPTGAAAPPGTTGGGKLWNALSGLSEKAVPHIATAAQITADNIGIKSTQLGAQQRYANWQWGQVNRGYQAAAESAQSQANIDGWTSGAYAKGMGDFSRTQSEMAEQASSDYVADQMTRVASQTAGSLAAQGVSNPYAISRNANMKAMAGQGGLGRTNMNNALYSGKGYQATVGSYSLSLNNNYGRAKLDKIYKPVSLKDAEAQRNKTWTDSAQGGTIQERIGKTADGIDLTSYTEGLPGDVYLKEGVEKLSSKIGLETPGIDTKFGQSNVYSTTPDSSLLTDKPSVP